MQTRYSKSTVCLHIPDTGNMWRQEWRRMKRHTKSATDGGDIYLPRTWMNHLYYYWTLERGKEIEKVGARKKKKEAELSLYFSFLQRFSNVISMLLLLEVWLSKQRDREREVETETPTERWLRDERTEGSREAETKWESRKEREPKRLHCCSTVESQRQLSHMSANRDGEWVKGIVGLFIDIKTTRFDCAETGEQSENRYRIKTFWETASVPSQMAKILLFVLFFFDGSGGNHRLKRSQRETTWERERKKESMTNRDTCLPT